MARFKRSFVFLLLLALTPAASLLASTESYIETLSGKIKKGDSCVVYDDKFMNMPLSEWNQVRHLSVENLISFELRRDTAFYYQGKPFTCTLNISIKYFTSRDQTSPSEINNIDLVVKYDTGTGKLNPLSASYSKLKNAFKVTIVVNSITSKEWGKDLPPVFRISNQILVERKYPFDHEKVPPVMVTGAANAAMLYNRFTNASFAATAGPVIGSGQTELPAWPTPDLLPPVPNANNQLTINWQQQNGQEEYDVEWTYIDIMSDLGQLIKNNSSWFDGTQLLAILPTTEESWMRNNTTRVTTTGTSYTIDLPYPEGFILFRVRGVSYAATTNVRQTTDWNYSDIANSNYAAGAYIQAHQPALNWQYTASFAEEGKRKEIISYFDGSLRSRQAVTIANNSTDHSSEKNNAVVAETIYDKMGRPTMNILPAPVVSTKLQYYLSINKNMAGVTYSRDDITNVGASPTDNTTCNIIAYPMSTASGTSQYYSPNNPFLPNTTDYFFAKYIPDAAGYPFSVTEYTADNTGRIRRQGGVGQTFQVGSGHDTRYYYSKPTGPRDLERLFGMEVGDVSHYEKNMAVDPNGQASVSYIDANGKTIATALAGCAPPNLDALPSATGPQAKATFTEALIQPTDFTIDAAGLYKSSSTTFSASSPGTYTLQYSVSPATAVPPSPSWANPGTNFCSNCYYDIVIGVTDNCGNPVVPSFTATPPFPGSDITCHDNPQTYTGNLSVNVQNIGEYTVTYTLKLSETEIEYQTNYYLTTNKNLYTIQHFFEQQLANIDLSGCYNDCSTCMAKLGSQSDFTAKMNALLAAQKAEKYPNMPESVFNPDTTTIQNWIATTYQGLYQNCANIQSACSLGSPCDQKKQMMKLDVEPGGQYATFDEAALEANATQVFLDRTINVPLLYYRSLPASYPADDGSTLHFVDDNGNPASGLSEADFIRAYQNHLEWADYFVTKDIEYCSYNFCKLPAVEPGYIFDQDLSQLYTTAAQATAKGYFDHSNALALLAADPFFASSVGAPFYSQMASDLQAYTNALNIQMKDVSGNSLPGKDIFSYVDWTLYCQPADPSTATPQQWVDSWQSCSVDPACRSANREWQEYRNFYLQLKSKYVRLAKQAADPTCVDCFIGKDALVQNSCLLPDALSNYSVVTGVNGGAPFAYIQYKGGSVPFLENYVIQYQATKSGVTTTASVTATQGALTVNIPVNASDSVPLFTLTGISCPSSTDSGLLNCNPGSGACPVFTDFTTSTQTLTDPGGISLYPYWSMDANDNGLQPNPPVILNDGSTLVVDSWMLPFYGTWGLFFVSNVYFVHSGGPVTRPVNIRVHKSLVFQNFPTFGEDTYFWVTLNPGQDRVLIGQNQAGQAAQNGSDDFLWLTFTADMVNCSPLPIASTCTSDSRYPFYLGKTRVFNEYIDPTCMNSQGSAYPTDNAGTSHSAASLQSMRDAANAQVDALKAGWLNRLQTVRDQEFPGNTSLSDAILTPFVDKLASIAKAYISVAPENNIRPASTLPPGVSVTDGSNTYHSFEDAFIAAFGTSLVAQGFSHHLLDKPYPYDKTNFDSDPLISEANTDICNNIAAFNTRYTQLLTNGTLASGTSFYQFLQQELGDDFTLTLLQLTELQNKCALTSCTHRYLDEALAIPVAFAPSANANHPSLNCTTFGTLSSNFATRYPGITHDTKGDLYELLFTNFMNFSTGYSLAYSEYAGYATSCTAGPTALLYDKPASPTIVPDDFSCTAGIMTSVFTNAGIEYGKYVDGVRIQFRNSYVSNCLAAQAGATMTSRLWEYHYTLYYYDQSGNLVKTIPPEGVRLLSDDEIDQVEQFKNDDPASCPMFPSTILTDKNAILTQLSSSLQANSAQSMEMWLFSNSGASSRQLRAITPDNKYMYQAAIANNKLWVELYTLEPGTAGSGDISMTLTNVAVANLVTTVPLQNWTHVVIQSAGGIVGGDLQLYVDGNKLTTIPYASAPPYPFDWEIDAGYTLPAEDVTEIKHVRVYNQVFTDAEVLANYRNSCLGTVPELAGTPMLFWGRFDLPTFCNNTTGTTQPVIIPNKGSLTVTSNPDAGDADIGHAFTSISNSTFTLEFWVKPQATESFYDNEITDPLAGIQSHNYAIFPYWGGVASLQAAGMGVAVGVNGVAVIEHADDYMPAMLLWNGAINGWTHIAIVYNNGTPSLYINGVYKATGNTSVKAHVYPSYNFGGGAYGYLGGSLDEVRIWNTARSAADIFANYSKSITPDAQQGLMGYWPMDGSSGNTIQDVTCNNNSTTLHSPAEGWALSGAPPTETGYTEFASRFIVPNHGMPTNYVYNSLNEVIQQTTPDAGLSQFWYDRLARLTASQNAEQNSPAVAGDPVNRYGYTLYDVLGRISEVGEKINIPAGSAAMSEDLARTASSLSNWLTLGSNKQVTVTAYDSKPSWSPSGILQTNLRKRVAATALLSAVNPALPTDPTQNRHAASYYNYDIVGNVGTLVQENAALIGNETQLVHGTDGLTGFKTIQYDYDLISGKVNKVMYQPGKWDQFNYQYVYDGDNRLLQAFTRREGSDGDPLTGNTWTKEANYIYYPHGPLARMELGPQVQGLDYAYTLQGWLKGVNGNFLDASVDMSNDGLEVNGNPYKDFGRDVIALSLGYYQGDYAPIGISLSPAANAFALNYTDNTTPSGKSLFDGNISNSTYAIAKLENGNPVGYTYRYDQLNRLKAMDRHTLTQGSATWNNTSIIADYGEHVAYDANGNIQTYQRNGPSATLPGGAGGGLAMDNLTYGYNIDANGHLINNKLRHVKDAVPAANYTADIDNQVDDNYSYDKIGNLTQDQAAGIGQVKWTVYGKVESISKPGVSTTQYSYDADGNRINKSVTDVSSGITTTTHYVRDASGIVMGVYSYKFNGNSTQPAEGDWLEQHLYGSGRLGVVNPNVKILAGAILGNDDYASNNGIGPMNGIIGLRTYELTNHLGNVLATISDNKIQVLLQGVFDHNEAQVVTAQDYYPFGMLMPGRQWNNGTTYRYGFNGQEKSDDINNTGNSYTAEFWEYDSRIGRRWNVDPVPKTTVSPYVVLGNSPILLVDPSGMDWYKNGKGEISHHGNWHSKNHKGYEWLGNKETYEENGYEYSKSGMTQILQSAVVTAKDPKLHKPTGADRAFEWANRAHDNYGEYSVWIDHEGSYSRMRNRGLTQDQIAKGDFGLPSDELNQYENYYQSDQAYRQMSFGAIALVLGPLVAVETGAVSYLVPKLELNLVGGATDFVNQKFIQGKEWKSYNILETITASSFGGNPVQYAVWGSSGSLLNFSFKGFHDKTAFKITSASVNAYKGTFVANLVSSSATSAFVKFSGIGGATQFEGAKFIIGMTDFSHGVFAAPLGNKIEDMSNEHK